MSAPPADKAGRPRPAYPIESVDNALRLLLMFREQPTVGVSEAGRALGVARSTAHRLLSTLEYHGFVTKDQKSRAYRPGAALVEFGLAVVRDMDLRSVARPMIEALSAELDETVHLAVLVDTDVLFIDAIEGTGAVRVGSRVGERIPAHLTSLGKAILAAMPRERVLALYPDDELPGRTPNSIVRRDDLLAELDRVAADGYATNAGESETDVGAVGMAILVAGVGRAAISVSAPLSRFDRALVERAVPPLRAAVAQVSASIS